MGVDEFLRPAPQESVASFVADRRVGLGFHDDPAAMLPDEFAADEFGRAGERTAGEEFFGEHGACRDKVKSVDRKATAPPSVVSSLMPAAHDCIVVGAGHNGLICACYLAKAGRKVLVLERRPVVGGAVCTEEIVPGYRFDVGSSAHIMFRSTPIMDELGLAAHGLEYIEMDPWAFYPVPGRPSGISFHRDLEKTCASIAQVSARDAAAYREFINRFRDLNEGVFETFMQAPKPGSIFGTIFRRNLFNARSRKVWSSLDTTRQLMTSYGRLIDETFESEEVRAALYWLAAQSGPPPDEIATGDLVGWQAMIHKHGAWRAKGGSGALTQALARCLRSLGGEVLTDQPVARISRRPAGGKAGSRCAPSTARPTPRAPWRRRAMYRPLSGCSTRRSCLPSCSAGWITCGSATASA